MNVNVKNEVQSGLVPDNLISLDFSSNPEVVSAVVEAERLQHGHMYNPLFATEISKVDTLPHQRIAVYDHLLTKSPLRFMLADDAGAGKTIMTGLYLREMFARQRMKRVLIVPPAGLVGNWERELRSLFQLPFKVVLGSMAKARNPFIGPDSNLLIVSIDTLRGENMFKQLRESVISGESTQYDLVVFDEAHKLAADRTNNNYLRKTERYRLAEALAGIKPDSDRWNLGWSAPNILLLTATPHMGKDYPYYCLWRLLDPVALTTFETFEKFSRTQKHNHFLRRTKEEMVYYDGKPIFPKRKCDTISYDLSEPENELYELTTKYILDTYNKADQLNQNAAKFAMTVFQRRQASSTHALLCSFERRLKKLDDTIRLIESGKIDQVRRKQKIERSEDLFDTTTADEDISDSGKGEKHEEFEDKALSAFVDINVQDLEIEKEEVEKLLDLAKSILDQGDDSKFERFRNVLDDPKFRNEKIIVFTEHRDTAQFLKRKLDRLGYTDQVSLIHGGLNYLEREAQIRQFKQDVDQGGSKYLIATDAAGEGINLQFCWLMINYDIPWNPARLEQRMGRIHRYGQKKDPVIIVNLIAGETREGRVVKTLLEKLELIRNQLDSEKVFDVVGRIFNNVSLVSYFEMSTTNRGADEAIANINETLTDERVKDIVREEKSLYGKEEIKQKLPELNAEIEREQFRRLLPGYLRRFVESAAPLMDLSIRGNPDKVFEFVPVKLSIPDSLLSAMEEYPIETQGKLTLNRPEDSSNAIWMHPGEAVFDKFCHELRSKFGKEAKNGAVFIDPNAEKPYLLHFAKISVIRERFNLSENDLLVNSNSENVNQDFEVIEQKLVGLKQIDENEIEICSAEHLLLLQGTSNSTLGGIPIAQKAIKCVEIAKDWISLNVVSKLVSEHQESIFNSLQGRIDNAKRGFNFLTAQLMNDRMQAKKKSEQGDESAVQELARIKEQQQKIEIQQKIQLQQLDSEHTKIKAGEVEMFAHAIVLPSTIEEEIKKQNKQVEEIAMQVVRAHEEVLGAHVEDVSKPEFALAAGLEKWPGFDIRSIRPTGIDGTSETRLIEVKGRAGQENVELSENEWAKAFNLREQYWLYAVFNCATDQPRLERVQDPIGRLLANERKSMVVSFSSIVAEAEEN